MDLKTPLALDLLALAGRFACPEDDNAGDEAKNDSADADAADDAEIEQPRNDPNTRIRSLVGERNAAQRQVGTLEAQIVTLREQLQQAQSGNESLAAVQGQVTTLQDRLNEVDDYFDGLLTTEMEALPEESRALVGDIPGGPRDRYGFLVKHRTRLAGAAPSGEDEPEERRGVEGPKHDRRPDPGKKGGVSAATQARIDRANARVRQGTGWQAVTGG